MMARAETQFCGLYGPQGDRLGWHHLDALRRLASFANGSGGVPGVMSGGMLAALVTLGVADRAPQDRIGGGRWVINAAGRELLRQARIEPETGLARGGS